MEISNETTVYNGHFKIKKYDVKNPKTGETHPEECFERGESVAALVYNSEKSTFLFTKQFRIGSKEHMIEIPAGSMDKNGEKPEDTLRRELMEELGVEIAPESEDGRKNFQYLGSYYVSPGGCSEKVHIFIVDRIVKKENGGGVDGEDIEIVELTVEETAEMFMKNKINDMKTILALQSFFMALNNI